jgi:hypothetical protein
MDWPWPVRHHDPFQPIQRGITVVTLIDMKTSDCTAKAMRWQGIKLAGATPIAVAVANLQSINHPIYLSHIPTSPVYPVYRM